MSQSQKASKVINILDEGDEDRGNDENFDLVDDMVRFRQNPIKFLETVRKYYNGTGFRGFNEYVGTRIFYPEWQDAMMSVIKTQPNLQAAIDQIVERRMDKEQGWTWTPSQRERRRAQLNTWVNEQISEIAADCMPKLASRNMVRMCYFVVAQVFSRCYKQGVHISEGDISRVRAKALELEKKKESLLVFPCHKSHVDYISLVFAFYRLGLSLPVTVAGENINIPVVGEILKHCGALYIKRGNWKDDPLYAQFFQAAVTSILQEGMSFQCFVEGTRSRTGKLLPPKFGILKFVLEAILNGGVKDAWVLPVSTQYDKVFEGDTFATELLGREKKAESLFSFLEASQIVNLDLGRVDIRFGEIWSLKGWIMEQLKIESVNAFPLERPISKDQNIHLLRSFGYRILSDVNKASAIMPSALVGAVLLTTPNRGTSREELIIRVRWLMGRILNAGGHVGALPKPIKDLTNKDIGMMVDSAINVLGTDMVSKEQKNLLETVYSSKDEFKLSYYRNQLAFLFVSEAITCIALYTLNRRNFGATLPREQLEAKVKFLSSLLANEFVYKPEGLDMNLSRTLEILEKQNVVTMRGQDEIILNVQEIVHGLPVFDFYCYLVWPFIDGYWSTCLSLFALPPNSEITERDFLKMAQKIARTLYAEGEIVHSEALNKELIKFAVGRFASDGIVQQWRTADRNVPMMSVTPRWQPKVDAEGHIMLEGPLYELTEEIARSRNKKLKYGVFMSVSARMLDIIQPVAASICTPKM